jgi:filamentous hemagglutinin family protein
MKYTPDFCSRFRILKGGKISLVVSALIAGSTMSFASPTGGAVTTGSATISQSGSVTTINQSTNKASINWNSFSIAPTETVNFVQPSAQSVTLNRVIGTSQSLIQGAMNAKGQVFLINPNGVLFANGSQINVGGLVASTLNITDENFQAGNYLFEGNSQNSVLNMGTITANNGYVAMMGKTVQNEGTVLATMGNVQMASGEKISLNLNGNSLVKLTIDQGTMDALVENKGLIQADGGQVYLTTQALNTILDGMVNNTGIIEANTLNDVTGEVILFAHGGTANIGGTIDASGGFVETSGKEFTIAESTVVKAGEWLIDPVDMTVTDSSAYEASLNAGTPVTIQADNNIYINDAFTWNQALLTLNAGNTIAINADMSATGTGSLALYYGQATADGGTSRYTVAEGIDVLIPNASAFTWKKGSGGAVTYLVFDNENLRFGNGTEGSINAMGSLLQPFYYDNVTPGRNGWFKLTYSNYPLDFAIGVGGATSDSWNNEGTILSTDNGTLAAAVSNLSINIADYFEKTGTITTNLLVNGIETRNDYTLNSGDYYLKAVTSVTNTTGSDLTNMRLWVGTRDDYVGPNDANYKTKGNIGSTGFEAITTQNEQAKAIIISEDTFESGNGAAILFYSTTAGADTVINDCCSFGNVFNTNPRSSVTHTEYAEDGSYGLFLNLGTLPDAQTGGVTWYYAAAPVSQLTQTVNQVGQSAGVTPPSTPIVIPYTLSELTRTYQGSNYLLNDLWSASTIFGNDYSSWSVGTDYVFLHDGQTLSGFMNAGIYSSIMIDILKDGYNEASSGNTSGKLTINKANATVTANSDLTKVYNGVSQSVSGFSASGLVNGETISVLDGVSAIGTGTNAGTYTVTASGTDENYNLTFVNGSLVIAKADATVTAASDLTKVYNGVSQSVSGFSASGLVNGETISVLDGVSAIGTGTNAGTYTVTAIGTDENYNLTFVNGSLVIAKADATVTAASDLTKVYNGVSQSVSGFSASGLVNGETISVLDGVSAIGTGINAGTYTVTASGTDENYNLTFVDGSLVINKADATVTAASDTKTYNGVSQSVSGFSATGLVNGETIAVLDGVSGASATGTNAGTYTTTLAGTDENYNLTFVDGSLVINKADATVTAASDTKTYNGVSQSVSGFSATGLVNGETIAVLDGVSGASATGTNAGTYTTTLAGTDENYNLTFVDGSLVINKADATVTAASDTKTYNGVSQSVSGFSATGLVNDETIEVLEGVTTSGGTGTNEGEYTLRVSGEDGNYNLTFVDGKLTIIAPAGNPAEDIVTTIVNQTTVAPPAPIAIAPFAPQQSSQSQTQTASLLQAIMPSSRGESFSLVGTTDGTTPVQTVSMEQLQSVSGGQGVNEIRVSLGQDSFVELVNGGVNLPLGLSQEFYVLENTTNKQN